MISNIDINSDMQLTSAKNRRLQEIHRAAWNGEPTEDGLIVAEGPHLLEEAIRSRWKIVQVLATASAQDQFPELLAASDTGIIGVSDGAFQSLVTTKATQGVVTLLRPKAWNWEDLCAQTPLIVALDGVRDPGNAGTIVRSAEAFGATGVVFLKGSVRVANGKFLRGTAGSIFRIPYLEIETPALLMDRTREAGITCYALDQTAATPISDIDLRSRCALIVGSEGEGVSDEFKRAAPRIAIPSTRVESLNAAIACSIALFEASRQRSPL